MKKLLFGVVAVATCTALLFGCGDAGKDPAGEPAENVSDVENNEGEPEMGLVQIANPIVSYDSAEAVAEKTGCTLLIPEEAADLRFTVISGEMAQADFNINGHKYNLRAQKNFPADGNITGVYDEMRPANFYGMISGELEGLGIYRNGGRWAVWHEGEITFSLSTLDECEEKEFVDAFYFAAGGKQDPRAN